MKQQWPICQEIQQIANSANNRALNGRLAIVIGAGLNKFHLIGRVIKDKMKVIFEKEYLLDPKGQVLVDGLEESSSLVD